MTAKKNRSYELIVKSETSQLVAIRDFISEKAKENLIQDSILNAIILAVDEAATNIVKHAYNYNPENTINIKLIISDKDCTIVLTDFGKSFDPSVIPQPDMKEYLSQHRVGGLGLLLIRTLMDSMEYIVSPEGFNRLILKKVFDKAVV